MLFKKISLILIAFIVISGISACSGNTDSGNAGGGKINLTLSLIREDRFLNEAISKYEELHPNINIEIKDNVAEYNADERRSWDTNEEIDNYAKSVNTQMMSGKASDILSINYLQYKEYADQNLLVNLNQMIENDESFNREQYYSNIFDALNYNDGLYGIPIKFYLRMLLANEGMLRNEGITIDDNKWTWDDFVSISGKVINDANANGDNSAFALTNISEADLIQELVKASYSDFVDYEKKSANFDSPEFINLLELAKKMIDDGLVNTNVSGGKSAAFASRGSVLFTQFNIRSFMDLSALGGAKGGYYGNSQADLIKKPSGQDNSGLSFYSNRVFGINNKSQYKDEAWDFIKFLISEEQQSGESLMGLPVNKAAVDKVANDNSKVISPQNAEKLSKMIAEINQYDNTDQGIEIMNILANETAPFFEGQKTTEEVAKLIQSKVNTYLQE